MALEDITKRILDDAKKEAEEIVKEADSKFKQALKEEKQNLKEQEEKGQIRAKNEANEEVKRRIALARLEARNKVLQEKQELLEKAYDKALKKVKNLSKNKYKETIKKVITEKYIPEVDLIILSQDLVGRDKEKFMQELNKSLEKKGKGLSLADEIIPDRAGFILKGKEVEINCTWEVMIKSIKEENSKTVYQLLFGEDK